MIRKPRPNRQGPNGHRPRGHANGHANPRPYNGGNGRSIGRSSGNPKQAMERYLALAREALTLGDRVTAEGYFQHAEHYYRVMTEDTDNG